MSKVSVFQVTCVVQCSQNLTEKPYPSLAVWLCPCLAVRREQMTRNSPTRFELRVEFSADDAGKNSESLLPSFFISLLSRSKMSSSFFLFTITTNILSDPVFLCNARTQILSPRAIFQLCSSSEPQAQLIHCTLPDSFIWMCLLVSMLWLAAN